MTPSLVNRSPSRLLSIAAVGLLALTLPPATFAQSPTDSHLAEVLKAHSWTWVDYGQTGGKELHFRDDGTVVCSNGQTWHWVTTGPNSVHFTWRGPQEFMDMYLNDTLTNFSCNDQHYNPTASGGWADAADGSAPADQVIERAASALEIFNKAEPQLIEWVNAPLDRRAPASLREMVLELQENLRDEAGRIPQASANTYVLADRICSACLWVFQEQEQYFRQSPREVDNQINPQWAATWARATVTYGAEIDRVYTQFREAVRVSPPPVRILPVRGISYVRFPSVAAVKTVAIEKHGPKSFHATRVAAGGPRPMPVAKPMAPAKPVKMAPHVAGPHHFIWSVHRPTL